MKVLLDGDNNFTEAFSEDEKKVLRKRLVGMILATDMAEHMRHIQIIDFKIKHHNIEKDKHNGHLIIDSSADKELF